MNDLQNEQAPVRACYRYLSSRQDQLDYKGAKTEGLPIGSGEIESSHRFVIQEWLKILGAWLVDNAACMIALRIARCNGKWNHYWKGLKCLEKREMAVLEFAPLLITPFARNYNLTIEGL